MAEYHVYEVDVDRSTNKEKVSTIHIYKKLHHAVDYTRLMGLLLKQQQQTNVHKYMDGPYTP